MNDKISDLLGLQRFTWNMPCHPSNQAYSRRRIGEDRVRNIFEISVDLHGYKARKKDVVLDSTVQGKDITFLTETKLLIKIVTRCCSMAKLADVKPWRSFQLKMSNYFGFFVLSQRGANMASPGGRSGVCGPLPEFWPSNLSANFSRKHLESAGSILTSMIAFSVCSVPIRAKFLTSLSLLFPVSANAKPARNMSSKP